MLSRSVRFSHHWAGGWSLFIFSYLIICFAGRNFQVLQGHTVYAWVILSWLSGGGTSVLFLRMTPLQRYCCGRGSWWYPTFKRRWETQEEVKKTKREKELKFLVNYRDYRDNCHHEIILNFLYCCTLYVLGPFLRNLEMLLGVVLFFTSSWANWG